MRTILILISIILIRVDIFSQNLLPDGSFESTAAFNYTDPASAFMYLEHWFPANLYTLDSTYQGTPDLFDINNRWPQSDPQSFWNVAVGGTEGDFHVGIANHMKFEGYLTPEAVGSSITQPLEPGEYYHIELMVRNKGVSGYQNAPILCVPEGYKEIDILFDTDTAYVVIDGPNKESYHATPNFVTLRSHRMESQTLGEWDKVGTCFQADGGEKFLTVTLSTGPFTVNPPCVIYDEHWDVFFVYYFDIDEVKLTKLPNELTFGKSICAGRPSEINVAELADLPIMQNEIQYQWEDGTIDSINYVSEAGTYYVNAVLDCKTIPIKLEITDSKCDPDVFVPNAFSPNGDGTNDQLEAFISLDLPILEYEFSVFNRWGAKVFSSKDINDKWDGTFQGENMENGVYVWLLEYTVDDFELGVVNYQESGDVTLFR